MRYERPLLGPVVATDTPTCLTQSGSQVPATQFSCFIPCSCVTPCPCVTPCSFITSCPCVRGINVWGNACVAQWSSLTPDECRSLVPILDRPSLDMTKTASVLRPIISGAKKLSVDCCSTPNYGSCPKSMKQGPQYWL